VRLQRFPHPPEDLLENLWLQPLPDHCETRVVRRRLVQLVVQELPDPRRVGAPGRDAALAPKPFEVAHDLNLEIDFRIDAGTPTLTAVALVERLAQLATRVSETGVGKRTIQFLVEGVGRRGRQLAGRNLQRRLRLSGFAPEHLRSVPEGRAGGHINLPIRRAMHHRGDGISTD
jgi:hypothetical protein